jgi:transketolase
LSIGLGHALAARVDKLDYRVYVMIGDGESDEGQIWEAAMEAAHALSEEGFEVRVLDMHTIKPLDETAAKLAAEQTGAIVTAEEHLLHGGLGAAVAQHYPVPMRFVGINNQYAESGEPEELLQKYHLMPEDIAQAVRDAIAQK